MAGRRGAEPATILIQEQEEADTGSFVAVKRAEKSELGTTTASLDLERDSATNITSPSEGREEMPQPAFYLLAALGLRSIRGRTCSKMLQVGQLTVSLGLTLLSYLAQLATCYLPGQLGPTAASGHISPGLLTFSKDEPCSPPYGVEETCSLPAISLHVLTSSLHLIAILHLVGQCLAGALERVSVWQERLLRLPAAGTNSHQVCVTPRCRRYAQELLIIVLWLSLSAGVHSLFLLLRKNQLQVVIGEFCIPGLQYLVLAVSVWQDFLSLVLILSYQALCTIIGIMIQKLKTSLSDGSLSSNLLIRRLWQLREDVVFINKISVCVSLLTLIGFVFTCNQLHTCFYKIRRGLYVDVVYVVRDLLSLGRVALLVILPTFTAGRAAHALDGLMSDFLYLRTRPWPYQSWEGSRLDSVLSYYRSLSVRIRLLRFSVSCERLCGLAVAVLLYFLITV